mgnify:CR=1 FL=1
MITPAERAVQVLDQEIGELGIPSEGTPDWFRIRALTAGRSLIKAMISREITDDPIRADGYYRSCRKVLAIGETS